MPRQISSPAPKNVSQARKPRRAARPKRPSTARVARPKRRTQTTRRRPARPHVRVGRQVVLASGPTWRGSSGAARHVGVMTYPVYAHANGAPLDVMIPLQLQYFMTIWPHAQLYTKVKLNSWSVRYTPNLSATRDGTVSLLFDPDCSRVMVADEDAWAQSKNAHIVRASVYRPCSLKFRSLPEYHEGGIIALDRDAKTVNYQVILREAGGWVLKPAGTEVPVRCSYGTTTLTTGGLNSLVPALAVITHDVVDASREPTDVFVAGYLNFHVDVSFMQMELGDTESVDFTVFDAAGRAAQAAAPGPVDEPVLDIVPPVPSPGPAVAAAEPATVNSDV